MKNLLYTLLAFAVFFTACEPNEEIYAELEDELNVAPSASLVFTLTDDDYAQAIPDSDDDDIQANKSFDGLEEARLYIPNILAADYPQLGGTSSAMVTFNLYRGWSPEVSLYTRADAYMLEDADYVVAGAEAGKAGFFNNDMIAEDYLPGILSTQFETPEDEKIVMVSYEYASKAYADIEGEVIFEEDFEVPAALDAYDAISVVGDQKWVWDDFNDVTFAKMSGYAGGAQPNEDWLVLSPVDLTGISGASLKVNQAINYLGDGVAGEDLAIKVSTDYTGDVTAATWETLELDQWPAGDNWDFIATEASLAAYDDQEITIAFYYSSTASDAATWEINSAVVEVGETIETDIIKEFYAYDADDAEWMEVEDNVVALSSSDYDAMGAPGQYDNFSSSVSADNYLPAFLKNKFPYAQEEDQQIVVYNYYSSSAGKVQTRGDLYTYLNGEWVKYDSVIDATMQFGFEDGLWVPDNTIKYALVSADYDFIGATFTKASGDIDNYGNFNMSKYSEEEVITYLSALLKHNFPEAEVGQKYLVSFATYNPRGVAERHLILTEGGNYVPVE